MLNLFFCYTKFVEARHKIVGFKDFCNTTVTLAILYAIFAKPLVTGACFGNLVNKPVCFCLTCTINLDFLQKSINYEQIVNKLVRKIHT